MFRFSTRFILAARLTSGLVSAEPLDESIIAIMQKRRIEGVSVAVIQNGEIVKATGYGFTDASHAHPVTANTLFQAGSVSKSVAALAALHLVEAEKLSLDADVNSFLRTWHVPESEFTKDQKVTLRRLLNHSAGLTVHGFPGYSLDEPVPSLVQVLDGDKPANTPAIRVDAIPGAAWRYSGGGYTVMQQMLVDVTGQPFPEILEQTVLKPLGMKNSTYNQPLPANLALEAATGHTAMRKAVSGCWHVYPEMAAAGLWTTPSDLARFAISIQQSVAERSSPVISPAMTREMLSAEKHNDGLGVFLSGSGKSLRFEHGGANEGFSSFCVAYEATGQGAVVMMNSLDNFPTLSFIISAVAKAYNWPDYPPQKGEVSEWKPHVAVQVDPKRLAAHVGQYEFAPNPALPPKMVLDVTMEGDHLMAQATGEGQSKFKIFPESETKFFSDEIDVQITFVTNAEGKTTNLVLEQNGTNFQAKIKE